MGEASKLGLAEADVVRRLHLYVSEINHNFSLVAGCIVGKLDCFRGNIKDGDLVFTPGMRL